MSCVWFHQASFKAASVFDVLTHPFISAHIDVIILNIAEHQHHTRQNCPYVYVFHALACVCVCVH